MYQTKNNTLLHLAPILFGIMIAMSGCEQPEISSQTLLKTSALSTAAPKTNNSSKTLAQNAIKQSTHTKLSEKAEAFAKTQLNLEESALLEKFFSHLAPRKSKIRFGSLVAQAGLLQLGLPYDTTPEPSGPETLNLRLNKFQCVSLVETSVALARCTVKEQPNEACFLKEMEENRYRGGENKGYSSRLHYFVDWLADNATRGRIQILSEKLGGET
ncbi:DUF1460 domain-containing protein, partial [Myxococcota bacterium]|nr:DUF1460 domain-containing protein [Myxococcota bacterium]